MIKKLVVAGICLLLAGAVTVSVLRLLQKSTPAAGIEMRRNTPARDDRRVIEVATTAELLAAIGPDRIVRLAPGEYNLSRGEAPENLWIGWTQPTAGHYGLVVRGVRDLDLVGPGDRPARIVVESGHVCALEFRGVENVAMTNIEVEAGHLAERREAPVLRLAEADGFRLDNCRLFGGGSYGLVVTGSSGVEVRESSIQDCTMGIVSAHEAKGLRFSSSRMTGNSGSGNAIEFRDCAGVVFEQCDFFDNHARGAFLSIWESDVTIVNCTMRRNSANTFLAAGDERGLVLRGTRPEDCRFAKDYEELEESMARVHAEPRESEAQPLLLARPARIAEDDGDAQADRDADAAQEPAGIEIVEV